MNNPITPKKENANRGFHYTVSDEQIVAYAKFTVEEKLRWIDQTNKFIYSVQTPEERERMKLAKNFDWGIE